MSLLGIKILSGNEASMAGIDLSEGLAGMSCTHLPCVPQVLTTILDRACQESISYNELADVISLDPGLCTRILLATSDETTGQLEGIGQLLNRLGLEKLQELLRQCTFQQFFHPQSPANSTSLLEYWRHSILCAANSRRLARLLNYEFIEQAWLAGLLHDIGRLTLGNIDAGFEQPGEILIQEAGDFNTTHATKGADMLAAWSNRSFLPDAIRYHHTESSLLQEAHILVRIVQVASLLSQHAGALSEEQLDDAANLLSLDRETVRELGKHAEHEYERIQRQSQITITEKETRESSQKLEQQVRKQALLYGHLSGLYGLNNDEQISNGIMLCVQRLFSPRSAILFTMDGNTHLRGRASLSCNLRMVQELSFSLSGSSGFVLQAVNNSELISASSTDRDARKTVLDNQILGLLASQYFLCLPLYSGLNPAGILLLGADEELPASLGNDQELLMVFSCEAGRILGRMEERPADTSRVVQSDTREEARKLVHEVSNPLTVVMNYLAVLSAKIGNAHIAREDVRIITEEIERVNDIVRQYADGMPKRDNRMVDINAVIQDMVRAIKEGLPEANRVSLKLDLDSSLATIPSNRDMLKQIMINLLKNAIEAVEPDGSVRVRSRGKVRMDNTDYVEIAVIDNGPGIADAVYSQLFQPVESTKGIAHSGLGLSIVYRLVSELGGKISCRTTQGKGTVFHILLPLNPS